MAHFSIRCRENRDLTTRRFGRLTLWSALGLLPFNATRIEQETGILLTLVNKCNLTRRWNERMG